MDDELRDLERAARADPGDLAAGRACAEALRRRGNRRACFLQLARLGRLGDPAARREVLDWIAWPGPGGRGNTHHRACTAVTSHPRAELLHLPGRSWTVAAASDGWIVLATHPPIESGPVRSVEVEGVRVDTDALVATWRRTFEVEMGQRLRAHGEDLVWTDGGNLFQATLEDGLLCGRRSFEERVLGVWCSLDQAFVTVFPRGAAVGPNLSSLPLAGAAEVTCWTRSLRGFPLDELVSGQPLVNVYVDDQGAPFHPGALGNWSRPSRTVLELLDPLTGEVLQTSSPIGAQYVQVLAWDDDGVLLRLDRSSIELRASIGGAVRWARPVQHHDDGLPAPVFTAREVVLLDPTPQVGHTLDLLVIDRASGQVRWSAPFPYFDLPRRLEGTGQARAHRVWGALAAAEGALYAALDHEGDVTVRGYDLTTGTVRFETRLGVRPAGTDIRLLGQIRNLQLVPQDGGLLALIHTATGATLARLR